MTCRTSQAALVVGVFALLAGCATPPPAPVADRTPPLASPPPTPAPAPLVLQARNDVALFALSLLDTPYTRGGRGPATGFDCSGLVNHVYARAAGVKLGGTSAQLGQKNPPCGRARTPAGRLGVFQHPRGILFSRGGVCGQWALCPREQPSHRGTGGSARQPLLGGAARGGAPGPGIRLAAGPKWAGSSPAE